MRSWVVFTRQFSSPMKIIKRVFMAILMSILTRLVFTKKKLKIDIDFQLMGETHPTLVLITN